MSIVLAEGDGLGGGFDFFASVVIGLLSVDHGIDGFDAILGRKYVGVVRLINVRPVNLCELSLVIDDVVLAWLKLDIRLLQEWSKAFTQDRGLRIGPGKELCREMQRKELFMTTS